MKVPPCEQANMYLAEDRIFCLEILVKKNNNYILNYVPHCKAVTDPPTSIIGLIKQRRRWTNGSMFASYHVAWHVCKIWNRSQVWKN